MTGEKTMLNVLVLTHYFPDHGGGVEVIAHQIVRHLSAQDASVSIEWFASNCDPPPEPLSRVRFRPMPVWNGIERRSGIPIPVWHLPALGRLWRAVKRSDVVHLHDFAYLGNLVAALFCRLQRKPYVVTQHIGLVPYRNVALRWLLAFVNRTLGHLVLSRADTVIFYSQEVARYFQKALPFERTTFIANGVDGEVFHPLATTERSVLRQSMGIDATAPVALFVGRFVEKKGVPLVVELARRFPGVTWIFAGSGPLDPEASLGPNARVVRGLRGLQIAQLYQLADVLVLPSRGEGFPLVVQESLSCGTPVLVERAVGDAAPDVRSLLWMEPLEGDETDITRWEARFREVLSGLPEADSVRRARAESAQARWDWNVCAARYGEVFVRAAQFSP